MLDRGEVSVAVAGEPRSSWATYAIEKEGGFRKGDERGVDFAIGRLVLGAQFARDMIYDAWLASADAPVGYPMVNVRNIESGKVRATRTLMGAG